MLGGHTVQGNDTWGRNLRSQLRVALFHVYGGSDWMNFLLALGGDGINEDLIKCYNREIDRRTPGGQHGREPYPGPRLSERSLAAAQGDFPLPPVRGVNHQESEAKVARRAARDLVKRLWRSQTMSDDARETLAKEADDAWARVDELSAAAGHAFYDRDGARVNAAKDKESMVTVVMTAYAELRAHALAAAQGCRECALAAAQGTSPPR